MAIVEISSGNQHSRSANMNWFTNSPPYGYGGRSADTSVLPVRIIMSPTCSSRFLVGKKTLTAAARTISLPPLHADAARAAPAPPEENGIARPGYHTEPAPTRHTPWYIPPEF